MDDSFQIPVSYKGKDFLFTSQLLVTGYTHKIQVDVFGTPVMFEPDEERNYRAYIDPLIESANKMDIALLKVIAEVIEGIVK
ncbi:MAG: hypothetical protein JWQ09_173 [Segetibacter sp.]|nr:hypothetical protein [Segetibacter sp.]